MNRYTNMAGLFGALLLCFQVGFPFPIRQVDPPPEYYPEFGHGVREPFLEFFHRTGGLAQHGYPITDDYVDPQTGLLVQYFEKSRLEWHPGNPEPYKVQLGLLGDELGKREPPVPVSQVPARNDPNCEHAEPTGHNICHAFRQYYHAQGGLERFGYPITEYTIEGERMVQYFQRARMEWHPEKPKGQQVQLAALGSLYYRYAGLNEDRLKPNFPMTGQGTPRALVARGSVVNSIAVSNGLQTTFVYVTDQFGQPIGNAAVSLVIHYPGGDEVLILPPTSTSGISFRTFNVRAVPAGTIVSMEFIVGYDGMTCETRTSFLIWY